MSIFGAEHVTDSAARRSSSRIGSMRCEWKACEVASVLDLMPSLSNRASTSRTAGSSPEMTMLSGPLKAAIVDLVAVGFERGGHSRFGGEHGGHQSAGRQRLHQPRPLGDQRRPSSSENTPAMHAAANSPTLWPITAAGSMPQLRHRLAKAYSIANITGCV